MKNRKIIIFILSLFIIWGFINVNIAYNSSLPYPIYKFIIDDFSSNNLNFDITNYPNNFFILDLEILISIILFIIILFKGISKYMIYSISLLIIIWIKNLVLFKGIIEESIYLKSSIVFLVSSILLIIIVSFPLNFIALNKKK